MYKKAINLSIAPKMLVPMSTDQRNGMWSDSSYRKDFSPMSKSSASRKGRGTSAMPPTVTTKRFMSQTVTDHDEDATASSTVDGEEAGDGFSTDQPPSVPVRTRESSSRSYRNETHKKMHVLQDHLQQLSIMTPDVMSGSPIETDATAPTQDGTMADDAKAAGKMTSSRGAPERGVQRSFSNSGGKKSARGRDKFLHTNHNDVEERRPASRSRSKSRTRLQRRLNTAAIAAVDALPNPDDNSSSTSPPPPQLRRSHTFASEYGMQELGHSLNNSRQQVLFTPRGMKKGTRQQILEGLIAPPALSRSVSTPLSSHRDESRSSPSQPYVGQNETFGDTSEKKLTSRRSGNVPSLSPGEPVLKPSRRMPPYGGNVAGEPVLKPSVTRNPTFGGNIADWNSDDDEES